MEEPPKKRGRGRPAGTFRAVYEKPRGFRLTPEDRDRLARLAAKWGVGESQVVRRLIREVTEREGLQDGTE